MLSFFPPTFYFPHFFTPFLFPLLYLPFFPFPFIPSFFPFLVTILSHISVRGSGSRVVTFSFPSTYSCTSPFQHLDFFFKFAGMRAQTFSLLFSMTLTLHFNFHDLHFDHHLTFSFITGVIFQSIPFFMHASPTDRSSILSLF
jgi:hypothetical protein